MSIDSIFRSSAEFYVSGGRLIANKGFNLPDGTYFIIGRNDGNYRFVSLYPKKRPDNLSDVSLGLELGPETLEIKNKKIKLPVNYKNHLGTKNSNLRYIIVGQLDYLDIWEIEEFKKHAGIKTDTPERKAA